MAWVKEVNDDSFLVADDWGPPRSDYATCYAKATLAIKTSGDKVNYTVTMYTAVDGGHSKKPGVALYLSIDGQVIFDDYWVYATTSASWNGFPTLNGSSRSGSITTKKENDSSIPVVLKVATTQRFNYADNYGSASDNITRTWYTNGTAPTLVVTDAKNNTATLAGSLGKDGTNNAIKSATLYYTTDGSDPSSSSTRKSFSLTAASGASYSKSVSVTKACTVKAYIVCKFEHSTSNKSASASVVYYANPSAPGVPVISYTKSRLTIKENWTYTWTAASAGNSNSPVKGYRVRVIKNGAAMTGLVYSASGTTNIISKGTNTNNYIDCANTNCTVKFDPAALGFKPGDTVKLGIYSYTVNGLGAQLFNGGGQSDDQVVSAVSTVQNAGVVHTKVNSTWKEGQVYVKVNNAWLEAETVSTKVNGTWYESE